MSMIPTEAQRECPVFAPEKVVLSQENGLVIKGELSDSEYTEAAHWLFGKKRMLGEAKLAFDRFLGQLILHYAAVRQCTWSDAISRLNLVEETNKAFKSLVKLPRIVSSLPEEAFNLPNLTTTHLDVVCSFSGPEDPGQQMEFTDARMNTLRQVSKDPDTMGVAQVRQCMRDAQESFGVTPKRRVSSDELKIKFMHTSLILINWQEEEFNHFGTSYAEALDHWNGYRNELVARGALPENELDMESFHPPWQTRKL